MKTHNKLLTSIGLCGLLLASHAQATLAPCTVDRFNSAPYYWSSSDTPAMPADQYQKGYPASPGCTAAGLQFVGADFSTTRANGGGSSATFMEVDAHGANFSNANFSGATFSSLFHPENANFSGANFVGAKFTGASINAVNFSSANLSGVSLAGGTFNAVNLTSANLSGADLSSAKFTGTVTTWTSGSQRTTDNGATFTSANLTSANLSKTNFSKANLSSANLTSANLSGATLTSANLKGANLTNALLNGADLTGADLTGATLTGAEFAGAKWTDGVTICTSGNKGMCQPPYLSSTDLAAVIKWIDDSVVSVKTPFCYKKNWGRGVGVPVSSCPDDKSKEGGLCYDKCRSGYSSDGATMCYQNCSSGWDATLTSCTKPAYYDRGVGIAPEIDNCGKGNWKCDHKTCKSNRQLEDGMCYLKPKDGFKCTVTVCTPRCPDGMTDFGVGCTKNSYNRGVGTPMTCTSSQELDASLCYQKCGDGATGVGPVCWQNCPSGTKACGVGCAASTAACADTVSSMVIAPVTMAANIFTGGTAGAVLRPALKALKESIVATDLTRMGAETAGRLASSTNELMEHLASHFDELVTPTVVSTLHANFGTKGYKWIAQQYGLTLAAVSDEVVYGYLRSIAIVDPTGVSGTVAAFAQPTCTRTPPFPTVTVTNKN